MAKSTYPHNIHSPSFALTAEENHFSIWHKLQLAVEAVGYSLRQSDGFHLTLVQPILPKNNTFKNFKIS
jgi:hypothetical protein